MNFLAGRVSAASAAASVVTLAGGARIALPAMALAEGDAVTLGLRPEHLAVQAAGGIPATVFAVERLGEGTYLYAHVDASGEQIVARADPDLAWGIGQRVCLGAPAARTHVFDDKGLRVRA
jgi:multiple sugar transport system ATP-binding protein